MAGRLFALLALLWIAAAGAVAAQDDSPGFLGRQIENALSGPGREVRVTGFEGALSGRATLERLTFADSAGVWLTIEDAVLDWTRAALLRGRLSVAELSADSITVARPPIPGPPGEDAPREAPDAAASGFALPELPVAVNIDALAVERLVLGAPVLGEQAVFTAEGSLRLEDGDGGANLALVRQDGTDDRIALDASFSNESRVLALDLEVREGEGGLIGTLSGLPGAPALSLDVEGTGPLDDYTARIDLATNGETRVAGTVTLRGTDAGGLRFSADVGGDVTPLVAPAYTEFFGPDVQLSLDGMRAEDGALDIDTLSLQARSLSLDGALALSAGGVPESFALTGRLADPENGPVRLPVAAPLTIGTADLSARYDAAEGERWALDLAARGIAAEAADIGALTLAGGGTIAGGPGELRVTAALDYAADGLALADDALSEALGVRIGGEAQIAWAADAPLSIERFTLGGADYRLRVEGDATFAERTLSLDGAAALSADDLSRFAALAGRPLEGAADIRVEGAGDVLGGTFELALDVEGEELAIGQEVADRFLEGPVTISAAARRDLEGTELERLRLDSTGLSASAAGRVGGADGTLTFEATLADLGLIRDDLEGPLSVAGEATESAPGLWTGAVDVAGAYGLDGRVAGEVGLGEAAGESAVTLDISLPDIAPLVPALQGGVAVTGSAVEAGGGNWQVDLEVDAPAGARAAVEGLVGGEETDIDLRVELPDVAAFAPGVPGSAVLEGNAAAYAPGGFAVTFDAELPFGATADLRGRVGASRSAVTYALRVPDLSAISPALSGPATAAGRVVQQSSGQIAVTADATGPFDATAEIGALIGTASDGSRSRAEATIRLPDAGALAPQFSGPLVAEVAAAQRPDGVWAVDLDADGPYGTTLAAEATLAEATEVQARLAVPDLQPVVPTLSGGLTATTTATRQGDGPWQVDLSGDGPFGATFAAQAEAGTGPLSADLQARLPNVASLVPRFSGAVALEASVRQPEAGAPLQVRADAALPYGSNAEVAGQVGQNAGRLRLALGVPNIAPLARGMTGSLRVTGTATERPEGWALDVQTAGPGAAAASVIGVLAPGGATSLRAQGTAPLGLVNGILAPQRLDGDLRFDLGFDGPPSLQNLSGTLSTGGARISIPAANLAFQNIDLTADIAGGRLSLDGQATSPEGGSLAVSGPIDLGARFPADLTLTLNGLTLTDPSLYRTTMNGQVGVSGPLTGGGGAIAGRIEVGETELRIPSGGVGFGANIPRVTHIGESAAVRQTRIWAGLVNERRDERIAEGRPGNVFSLDLTIDAPNRIFLRGRGLDAELGGSFTVGGTTRRPAPVGGIEVIRGRLDILGRRLELADDGRMTLGGDLLPFLELAATSDDAGDFTIIIRIEGPVNEPTFAFESQPPLPEDEVLARFFFGKGLANLSALEAAQLAASVARLTGRGGNGLLGGLRESLGVSDLDLVTDDDGDAALQIGTYLSENIYTDVTTSSGGETEVNIKIDITDDVTVQGSADNEGETSIGIFYQRDY
ncbi:MAG: translocation/assembly module TamB domain-containing protein [Paracoccaceae bacterium]|jgi:translocation and assembly module TamB|nr:translocation/assembly module TamB domain-containing protein [Paracoccaceae bacterium]